MFESIDDEFAGALARVVMLGALIESWVDLLVASLDHNPQSHYAGSAVNQQLKTIRTIIAKGVPARPTLSASEREHILKLQQRVEAVMWQRNDVLHSVWPRPSLSNGQGWRHLPRTQREAEHIWTKGRQATEGDLLGLIAEMVAIVREVQRTTQEVEAHPRAQVPLS